MKPLTLDDLTPLGEYATRRAEFFDAHVRYRDRYRRLRIGPKLTLIFENRQTLWFRVHEFLRIARLADPAEVRVHLEWFNRLLPKPDHLQAALLIDQDDGESWRDLNGEALHLVIESISVPAKLVTARPEDRAAGTAHWVEFALFAPERAALADYRRAARVEMEYREYHHASALLTEEMRESLLDDLKQARPD